MMDPYTRECLSFEPGNFMSGTKVAHCLKDVVSIRCALESVTMNNGTESQSRAMGAWTYENRVRLDFIRPGKPVGKWLIESFNGWLRDECLNTNLFWSLEGIAPGEAGDLEAGL